MGHQSKLKTLNEKQQQIIQNYGTNSLKPSKLIRHILSGSKKLPG